MSPECLNKNLVEVLKAHVEMTPDKTAFTFLEDGEHVAGALSYAQLDRESEKVAAAIQTHAQPGDRVLLLFDSCLEFVSSFYGCLYAGAIAVPAYPPRYNRNLSRVASIMRDCQPTLVIAKSEVIDLISELKEGSMLMQQVTWLAVDQLPESNKAFTYQRPEPDSVAFLQYTSGSTGDPKGVMVTHENLISNEIVIRNAGEIVRDDVSVSWLPLFHDLGLIGKILQSGFNGGHCVFMPPEVFIQNPVLWLKAITKYKATISGGPNFGFELCALKVKPEELKELDLSSWRTAPNGAEPIKAMSVAMFQMKFARCGFKAETMCPGYGMAETTLVVSSSEPRTAPTLLKLEQKALANNTVLELSKDSKEKSIDIASCGRPGHGISVQIVDQNSFSCLQDGQVGEIWVQGTSVTKGYWQRKSQTEENFQAYTSDTHEGPYLRTGDLGFMKDGQLHITGRLKEVMIINGQNHYPQDVEVTAQKAHIALRPGCGIAFSVAFKPGEEQLVIVQEVRKNYLDTIDADKVFASMAKMISKNHSLTLSKLLLLAPGGLPKTSSGKLQRTICKERFLLHGFSHIAEAGEIHESDESRVKLAIEFNATETKVAAWLKEKISQYMEIESAKVNLTAPFYEYDSITNMANLLAEAIQAEFKVEIDPILLWSYANLNELVRRLAARIDSEQSEVSLEQKIKLIKSLSDKAHDDKLLHIQKIIQSTIASSLDLVNQNEVPVKRSLHELGIDSMAAIQIRADLERVLGIKLPATLIFDYPTVAALAAYAVAKLWPADAASDEALDEAEEDWDELSEIEGLSLEEQQSFLNR